MIDSKSSYRYYVECDRIALGGKKKLTPFGDEIYKYEKALRYAEYQNNCGHNPILKLYSRLHLHRLMIKTGFQLPLNCCAPGLCLVHLGTVIVATNSKIGENCRIQSGVTIGSSNLSDKAPIIGNNVFLGEGAKIIGDISIADGVQIGANAVVVKSITEPNTTWAGVPAKKISQRGSDQNIRVFATDLVKNK